MKIIHFVFKAQNAVVFCPRRCCCGGDDVQATGLSSGQPSKFILMDLRSFSSYCKALEALVY
jgi:hypothetical protein